MTNSTGYKINEEANFSFLKDGTACIDIGGQMLKIKGTNTISYLQQMLKEDGKNVDTDNKFIKELIKYNVLISDVETDDVFIPFGKLLDSVQKKFWFVVKEETEHWENDILLQSSDQWVVFTGTLYDYKFAEKVNIFCRENERNIINIFMIDSEEIVMCNIINSSPSQGCFSCFTRRLVMNSKYIEERLKLADDIHEKQWSGKRIQYKEDMVNLLEGQITKLVLTNASVVVSIEKDKDKEWDVTESTDLIGLPDCNLCYEIKKNDFTKFPITSVVNKRVGIVKSVETSKVDVNGINFYVAISNSTDFRCLNRLLGSIGNSGAGFEKEMAVNAAIGETLERYSSAMVDKNIFVCSFADLQKKKIRALNPSEFELFSEEQYGDKQFPYVKFNEDTMVGWTSCKEVLTGEEYYVPAAFVYLPYLKKKEEKPIAPYISTGLASNYDYVSAVLSGIYEIIERDAFSISWLKKIPPILVDSEQTRMLNNDNLKCRNYELTLDIPIPTVVSIMEGNVSGRNVLSIGAAARASLEDAIKKANTEALQGRQYVYDLVDLYKDVTLQEDFRNIDTFQKHAMFYTKFNEMREKEGYLIDENQTTYRQKNMRHMETKFNSEQDKLCKVVKEINKCGFQVYVKDITPVDLQRYQIKVVRVIIPGLHGLHGAHKYRFLGGKRMNRICDIFQADKYVLNQYPHPFP